MLFVFGGMTVNAKAAVTKNADDVKALEKIINEKRKSGGKVSANLDNKKQYRWNPVTGRLEKIVWNVCDLKGIINFNQFSELIHLDVEGNNIRKIHLGKLEKIRILNCSYNRLKKLNVSKCTQLKNLDCSMNNIERLDVRKLQKLK